MTDVLLTCPPMIGQIESFQSSFVENGWHVHVPEFRQTLTEDELIELVPDYDGWIIGDDPATRRVVEAGAEGRLRAAVKWGVGTDNVDFKAFADHQISVANTPGMFGQEVADIALGYVIGLSRQTFSIDRSIREGGWPKPAGISLAGKRAGVVGFGDIGQNTAARLTSCGMAVTIYDPFIDSVPSGYEQFPWPEGIGTLDFLIFTCALTPHNRHMLNADVFRNCKKGLRLVNVARGPLIDESALVDAQIAGIVHSCALDVFEEEPLGSTNSLLTNPLNIFGSHNASNTVDAVERTSRIAMQKLKAALA